MHNVYGKQRHGKAVGYVVYSTSGGVGTLCHGEKPGTSLLLFGKPGTLFKSRRRAQAAIDRSIHARLWAAQELMVIPVAPVATKGRTR
jgi:hypothetical protein